MAGPESVFRKGLLASADSYITGVQRISLALYNLDLPTIAAVNSPAVGAGAGVRCSDRRQAVPCGARPQAANAPVPSAWTCRISWSIAAGYQALMDQTKEHHEALPHSLTNESRCFLASDGSTLQMTLPDPKKLDQIARMWNHRGRGLITEMNLKIEKVATDGVLVRMPFNPSFCADEDESLLHGGVLTALLDSVFGLANLVAIDRISSMATLDLRVDYLRPARSRADVMVRAECYRQTRHIAFNSGTVWFDEPNRAEVARGTASFALMRGERSLLDAMTRSRTSK